MDRSSFPNKQQDKSSYNHENKEDLKHSYSGGQSSTSSNSANQIDADYINSCMEDLCINGGSLVAYKKQIEKLYPTDADFYTKCESFLEQVNNSVKVKKFTNTSVRNLEYLGSEIYLTVDTIRNIVEYYQTKFEEEVQLQQQREKEERERIAKEEEERRRRIAQEEEEKRKGEERAKKGIDTVNYRYIAGTAITMLISLICIGLSGWCIFISCVTIIGSAIIISLWYKFVEKNSIIPKYFKGIIWTAGIVFPILFVVVFFTSHSWWSLFSILLIGAYGLIVQWIYDGI
jgi:uncharacterized membrane protein